jgi:hypothetical protein
MTIEFAKTLLEFIKLAPRYLVALGIAAAVLLFAKTEILKSIGVFEFTQANRSMLGLTLVVTSALFAVSAASDGISSINRWWIRRRHDRRIIERLNCLTEDEKQILRFYFAKNTRANVLRVDEGVVQGLRADGIIFQSASLGNVLEGWAHNIGDIAWDYIHVYPNLLEGTTNTYRTDKRDKFW